MNTFTLKICIAFCSIGLLLGCRPVNTDNDKAVSSNGKILTGDLAGSEFVIADGNEDEMVMDMIDAFNNMDIDGVWENIADTISFHGADGYEGPFTKDMLAGYFAEADSVQWEVWVVIPIQVKGDRQVSVLVESHEKIYMKDGSHTEHKLFERFIFEDGQVTSIRQWDAEAAASDKSD